MQKNQNDYEQFCINAINEDRKRKNFSNTWKRIRESNYGVHYCANTAAKKITYKFGETPHRIYSSLLYSEIINEIIAGKLEYPTNKKQEIAGIKQFERKVEAFYNLSFEEVVAQIKNETQQTKTHSEGIDYDINNYINNYIVTYDYAVLPEDEHSIVKDQVLIPANSSIEAASMYVNDLICFYYDEGIFDEAAKDSVFDAFYRWVFDLKYEIPYFEDRKEIECLRERFYIEFEAEDFAAYVHYYDEAKQKYEQKLYSLIDDLEECFACVVYADLHIESVLLYDNSEFGWRLQFQKTIQQEKEEAERKETELMI